MAEIVNLRRVRKGQQREAEAQAAAENRARYGRTRGEREAEALRKAQATGVLDGARLAEPAQAGAENPAEKRPNDRQTTS